eukprot:TRINITY_DN31743_c0_g1_i1.p1 TRINITY_DN31743_c0_g1~~TRINITY_DN31743_c0_g1_i1.p1  ORF type:complete len:236 (+),score=36.89 TRINITY_DN31743_c0_g1_i1:45-752(+)
MERRMPLELQFLLRQDPTATVDDYWVEGHGWDVDGIKHDTRIVRQQRIYDVAKSLSNLGPIVVDDCSEYGSDDVADDFDTCSVNDAISDPYRGDAGDASSWDDGGISTLFACEGSDCKQASFDQDTDDMLQRRLAAVMLAASSPEQVSSTSTQSKPSMEVCVLPPEVDLTATPDVDFESSSLQHDGTRVQYLEDGSVARWTQRPDGSWRKPERKRPGWEAELERKKYICPRRRHM